MVYTVDIQRMHSTQHNVLATWSQAHVAGSSCTVRTYACVSNLLYPTACMSYTPGGHDSFLPPITWMWRW